MGVDKATLELEGRTLLQHAIDVFDQLCAEVVLATGSEARYPELGRPQVLDRIHDAGPLAGLEAGLAGARTEWVVAVACDMPWADARVFERLLERARERGFDACLFESRTGPEPLCGAYKRECLSSVSAALDSGARRMISFERFPTEGGTPPVIGWLRESELEAELRDVECAFNVNTPLDLERARQDRVSQDRVIQDRVIRDQADLDNKISTEE